MWIVECVRTNNDNHKKHNILIGVSETFKKSEAMSRKIVSKIEAILGCHFTNEETASDDVLWFRTHLSEMNHIIDVNVYKVRNLNDISDTLLGKLLLDVGTYNSQEDFANSFVGHILSDKSIDELYDLYDS